MEPFLNPWEIYLNYIVCNNIYKKNLFNLIYIYTCIKNYIDESIFQFKKKFNF